MNLPRRQFLHLAAGAAALPGMSRLATAQTYPTRPVRLLIGFAPGGTQDVIGRLLGQWLMERLGQQVIIENRPGAASNIAAEAAIRSPPDGYTLFMIGPNNAINASVYAKLGFDIVRDSAPVAVILRVPNVMEVNPAVPVTSVPEFIAYAKANPGKINFASGGVGTSVHVSGELFKMMTGVNMQHVTYRGAGPALTDLLAGQVHLMFDNLPSSVEHIRASKLRALAVTTTAARTRCRTSRPWTSLCRATRPARSSASLRPGTRRRRSSGGSTWRSMQSSPTPRRRRGWPTWVERCCPARPPTSAISSPAKPRSGPKW